MEESNHIVDMMGYQTRLICIVKTDGLNITMIINRFSLDKDCLDFLETNFNKNVSNLFSILNIGMSK